MGEGPAPSCALPRLLSLSLSLKHIHTIIPTPHPRLSFYAQGIAAIIAATSTPEPKADPRARFQPAAPAAAAATAATAAAAVTIVAADKALA